MHYATCEILLADISILFYTICINISLIDENKKIKICYINLFWDKVSSCYYYNSEVFNHTDYI